jgi:peptidoglycan/LPS O-acetylase OafA/YrhL
MGSATSDNFHAIRLALALAVIYSHSNAFVGNHEPIAFGHTLGAFAVHCFFVISGYLVTGSWISKPTAWVFALKRSLRIAPALFCAYLFSRAIFPWFDGFGANPNAHIANGSLWTLSWEVLLYVIVLLLGVVGLLRQETFGTVYFAGIAGLVAYAIATKGSGLMVGSAFFSLFLGGAFIRFAEDSIRVRYLGVSALGLLLLAYGPGNWIWQNLYDYIPFLYGPQLAYWEFAQICYLVALPFAVIFLARYLPFSIPFKNDYSYGTYLYAWPIQQVVVMLFAQWSMSASGLSVFIVSSCITLIFAMASWHFLEKPALGLIPHQKSLGGRQSTLIKT